MKYFVVSDVHSFYTLMIKALKDAGFDANNDEHKIILCGDAFDRGDETIQMYNFIKKMIKRKKLIYIMGNHEDLLIDAISSKRITYADISNGTFKTAMAFAAFHAKRDVNNWTVFDICEEAYKSNITKFILDNAIDYFETKHYIFTHGYLPIVNNAKTLKDHIPANFRKAKNSLWKEARWLNGMKVCMQDKIKLKSKTIVCGHWNCSYGNVRAKLNWDYDKEYEANEMEFKDPNDLNIFYGVGVIGIDACTVFSHRVNCLVIEDEEL